LPTPVKFTVSGIEPDVRSAWIAADGAASLATPLPTKVSSSSSKRLLVGPLGRCAYTRYRRCGASSAAGSMAVVTSFATFAPPLVTRSAVPTSCPSGASSRSSTSPPAPAAV
jgi:hypothetical protein